MATTGSPCAACKFLRRKCMPDCVFSPYFPPDEPQKFANVHKIFGASNVSKLLNEVPPHQREDAVNSLAYEAEARVKDPVYGCVGAISVLQRQIQTLQKELDAARSELLRYAACTDVGPHMHVAGGLHHPSPAARPYPQFSSRRSIAATSYYHTSCYPYPPHWTDPPSDLDGSGEDGRQSSA